MTAPNTRLQIRSPEKAPLADLPSLGLADHDIPHGVAELIDAGEVFLEGVGLITAARETYRAGRIVAGYCRQHPRRVVMGTAVSCLAVAMLAAPLMDEALQMRSLDPGAVGAAASTASMPTTSLGHIMVTGHVSSVALTT